MPNDFKILVLIELMCDCQLRSLSMTTPKNLIFCTSSIPFSSNFKLFEVSLCLDL